MFKRSVLHQDLFILDESHKVKYNLLSLTMPVLPPKKPKTKNPAPRGRGWRSLLGGPSFFGNVLTTVLIFLILMSGYSLISNLVGPSNTVPLSVVATDVAGGKVSSITVSGDSLNLTYADGAKKTSR